jgi:hypothetical protein
MQVIVVPIQVDALFLKTAQQVIGAKADFSRLPYFNKEKKIDVNSDIANISENVLSQPFQSHSLQLEAGIHLHWALPDLLTAGRLEKNDRGEKLVYPNVPDRWLITRINGKNQKQWVVESNFLQKEGSNNVEDGISFPLSDYERGSSGQPFRYMGRQIDLSEKDTLEGTHQYFDNLTALGYGDPSFGAFYPECHSVFGCHDPLNETLAGKIEYEVIGWYNRPEQDYFAQTLIEINNSKEISSLKNGEKATAIEEALLKNLNISAEISEDLPEKLLCYGRLILEDGILKDTQDTLPTIEKIAIGNTATEALSAMLNEGKIIEEKQLEAIRLMSKIGTQRLDLNAKFEEAFHDNGFSPIDGGSVWTITVRKTSDKKDQNTPTQFDTTLPGLFAHHLNILNNFQQQFDRATDEFRDLKQQLFSDWYKFMVSGNHPYIHKDELSDPDEIRFFIENNSIVELKKKSDQREKLSPQDNHKGEIWKASEQVKKDNDNFNTGRIPKHKQGRNFKKNELFFTADESKGRAPGLHLNGDIQEISFETYQNEAIEVQGPNAAIFIKLNDTPHELLDDDALALTKLQADLKQACLNQALADLKQAKAISLFVNINGLNSSENFNLIRIENEDHSEIGPAGIGSFWKSIYIDGQKMDPYTLHKWLEIPKDQWIHLYLEAGESFADRIILLENFSAEGGGSFASIASIASIRVMKQTLTENERACDRNIFRQQEYKLEKGAAPRYWQANEPVIMMSGPACEPSPRHGFDGKDQEDNKLKCYILELDTAPNEISVQGLFKNQDLKSFYNKDFQKYLKWTAQPWNPIMLDWEVEIFPLKKNDENDIVNHFTLQDHHPDLILASARNQFEDSGVIFSGNTLLSPHAKIKVLDAINNYLENPNHKKSVLVESISAQKEQIEKGHFLSQAFSGFNAAMLMHKQTMQLPIDDPLAFEDYSGFSQKIKELVGDENKWAPMPKNPFSPIRAGKIRVLNLRLIDSFGRHVDAPVEKNTIHSHAFPTAEDMAVMPPRITQPARLNLRWISANRDELEMNSHPESSPICGWILPNNLDNSMMIYDQSGDLLGLIDQKGIWEEGPGNRNKISIQHIPNKHLRRVVLSLEKDSTDFLKMANKTLEQIDPESFAQHLDLALLMGRPIAIVRASLNLELKGRTAVNQSWDLFTKDIDDETYDTEGFERTRFPVRLGEPGQFNDGVIGFWKDGEPSGAFQATITGTDTETIHYYRIDKPNITVSIADAPQTFTMLIDPRAKVHVVSGIQPTKVINLPPDQYMDALRRIDIFFMASPILCPKGRIALPLPIEPGFEWSWISKQKTTWSEITKTGRIDKHKVLDAFPNGQNLWDDLVLQKWIDPLDGFTANIVTKNERKNKTLSPSTAPMTDKIEFMLNQCMIIPPDYAASFKDKSDIREGWLKLSHNTKNRL